MTLPLPARTSESILQQHLKREHVDVALVHMPFAPPDLPCLTIALLISSLRQLGVSCRAHFFNISFCAQYGVDTYREIVRDILGMPGECLFSGALFDRTSAQMAELSGDVALRDYVAAPLPENEVRDFVQRCADIVLAASPS